MALVSTYYDMLKKLRPYVIELAEQDAQLLRGYIPAVTSIHSVDDYDSLFGECLAQTDRALIDRLSAQTGLSLPQLPPGFIEQLRIRFASMYLTVTQEYHCAVNFALAQHKVFHFSDHLTEHLANTEINTTATCIQLPFTTCLFTFTSPAIIRAMQQLYATSSTGTAARETDHCAPVSVFLTVHNATDGLPGRKLVINAWHAKAPHHVYSMQKRELYLPDHWTLEQALHTDWETLTPENTGLGIAFNDGIVQPQDDDAFYTDGLLFYRILMNAILYLSCAQAELTGVLTPRRDIEARAQTIVSPVKKRKVLKESNRITALAYQEVGASVGPIVIKRGANADSASSAGKKGKPVVRFMVRGHWRQQPHGPERQARKLIWIQPFYKGEELAQTINKPYLAT